MKMFTKISLVSLVASMFFTTTASAGWMIVNEDGSKTPYTEDCCVKHVKRVKRVKKSTYCKTCDYSAFPEAKLYPIGQGERLAPARLGNCGRK